MKIYISLKDSLEIASQNVHVRISGKLCVCNNCMRDIENQKIERDKRVKLEAVRLMKRDIAWLTFEARASCGHDILDRVLSNLPEIEKELVSDYLHDNGIDY